MEAAPENGVADSVQQPVAGSKFEIVTKEMVGSKKRKLSLSDELEPEDENVQGLVSSPKRSKIAHDASLLESSFEQSNKSLVERKSFIETVEALSQIDDENPVEGQSVDAALVVTTSGSPTSAPHMVSSSFTAMSSASLTFSSSTAPMVSSSETPLPNDAMDLPSQVAADQLPVSLSIDQYRETSDSSQPASQTSSCTSSQLAFSQDTTEEYAVLSQEGSTTSQENPSLGNGDGLVAMTTSASASRGGKSVFPSLPEDGGAEPMGADSSSQEAQPTMPHSSMSAAQVFQDPAAMGQVRLPLFSRQRLCVESICNFMGEPLCRV